MKAKITRLKKTTRSIKGREHGAMCREIRINEHGKGKDGLNSEHVLSFCFQLYILTKLCSTKEEMETSIYHKVFKWSAS